MKIEILQENLSQALSQALKFVSTKVQLPILSNFLLEAEKGILKISASDLEKSIILFVGAKVESDGKATVSAKTFADFIFALPPEKVTIQDEEEVLVVKSGKSKAKFNTMPSSEFPKIESSSGGQEFLSLEEAFVKSVSEKTCFATSQDVSRPAMTGVYFDNKAGKLKIVATDGFRLSLVGGKGQKEDFSINAPASIIEELGKIAGEQEKALAFF